MNKKRLLIVDKSFATGGIQTSMLNMIECIKDEYDISLFLYYSNGPLKYRLPHEITVLKSSWMIESCGMSFKECMRNGTIRQKIFRVFATLWTKIFDNRFPLALAIRNQAFLGEYDVAIAYHHEAEKKSLTSGFIRLIERRCSSEKKISWVHNDSGTNEIDEDFNDKYYKYADQIVAVSNAVRKGFVSKHPELLNKTTYFYNFLDYKKIETMSKEEIDISFPEDGFICFSACRLEPIKGLPRAIHSIAYLFRENPNFVWYIAGDGVERNAIVKVIDEEKLTTQIILLGNQTNPYKYMKRADLVVSTSYHEAAPMIYMEANFLGIPVFSTITASTYELLNERSSIICENSSEGIEKGFKYVIENIDLIKSMKVNNMIVLEDTIKEKKQTFAMLLE